MFQGIIYKATNIQNNKCYIGQTTESLSKRKYDHKRDSIKNPRTYFQRALKKEGNKKFKWEILGYCKSIKELNEAEIICIDFFKSNNRIYGYNILRGGNNGIKEYDPLIIKTIKHLYEKEKWTFVEILKHIHISGRQLKRIFIENKIIYRENPYDNKNRYVTKNIEPTIIYMYTIEKMGIKTISKKLNIGTRKIKYTLSKNNIEIDKNRKGWDCLNTKKEIIKKISIAKKGVKLTKPQKEKIKRGCIGINKQEKNGMFIIVSKTQKQKVVSLYKKGLSLETIYLKTGVHRKKVKKILDEYKIKRRTKSEQLKISKGAKHV